MMRYQLDGISVLFLLLLQLCWLTDGSWAQRNTYSLQAALDELHRRESDADAAKYPLNAPPTSSQRYIGSALGANGGEQDYWDDDTEIKPSTKIHKNQNRYRLNKALAKYLEHDNADHKGLYLGPFAGYEFANDAEPENNNLLTEEKKRVSFFRERDNKYENPSTSVFRERELQSTANAADPHNAELTEEFLKEIEEATERERQQRYKETLQQLWEKYQEQENEVNSNIFEEKKRMRLPPYYMLMQKKRSYPVLPWLPYSADKKKRFPVSKRSARRSMSEAASLGKTDEKVAKELSELFGKPLDEKKKRSTDAQIKSITTTHVPETTALADMRLEIGTKHENITQQVKSNIPSAASGAKELHQHGFAGYHDAHVKKDHKHRKRSDHAHHSHESDEESEEDKQDEHEHEHEDDEADSDEDEHDEFDEEEDEERRKKKKKRDTDINHNGHTITEHSKKSIDWSQYFGLDRKKKSVDLDMKKRSVSQDEVNNDEDNKQQGLDPAKLENMDKKLQSIEDFIIDETIKYTGAHEGISNHDEIRRLKDHVLSRLATAYSLEKMRRALDKLRQSVENENHLMRNVIEADSDENEYESLLKEKRLSVKKEQADARDNDSGTVDSNIKAKKIAEDPDNELSAEVKKKKKRNGYLRYPELPNDMEEELFNGPYESFNDAYLGNKNYMIGSNKCPLIESMAERCRGVDLLGGDLNQELLPICGVHQICYLCGSSQVACDYQYLAEADTICGSNNDCQSAARSVLMILRGTPGPQLGPRECLKNPCLYSAMPEIGL